MRTKLIRCCDCPDFIKVGADKLGSCKVNPLPRKGTTPGCYDKQGRLL